MTATNQQVALITGATGGIGHATTLAFARQGYRLALHYNTATESTVQSLIESATAAFPAADTQSSPRIQAFQADLSSLSAVDKLHADVTAAFGPITILFANAGSTSSVSGPKSITDVSLDVFEQTWRVNTLGPYRLAQLCVPDMQRAGWGRIVFNSSVAGLTGGVVGPHYASSKAAVHGLVHWLAGNLAKEGVTVNAVAPALIEGTGMLPGGSEELAKKIPIGRLGLPEEIAETVLWMVKNGYVTNKVVAVDGGMVPR